MTRGLPLLLLTLTFIESFASILGERGIYFHARQHLGYSDTTNLWLSLAIGLGYIAGAMLSHRLTARWAERSVLLTALAGQATFHLLLTQPASSPVFFALNFALALATGVKWPIIESYVSAGRDPRHTARVLGYFNCAWALAVPLSIPMAGFLIDQGRSGLFLLGAAINLVAIGMTLTQPRQPTHLADDHPGRLTPEEQSRTRAMCQCARWNLVSSYTLMFVLAPLAPTIAHRLGYTSALAGTLLMSVMEVMRMAAFVGLQVYTGWHGRPGMLVSAALALPAGFAMVLFGGDVTTVIVGQVAFGLACGIIYYAALYYAMVTHNASVDAGGLHEALIGAGFAIGPAIGLAGQSLRGPLGGQTPGMLVALTPLVTIWLTASLRPIVAMRRDKLARQRTSSGP